MLTDATCPPDKARVRFTDEAGLYLEISSAGSKRWFWKTYADGKEGALGIGQLSHGDTDGGTQSP